MNTALRTSLLLAGVLTAGTAVSTAADRPNVIVILTDDQGTADLHIAGATDIQTPHLDALARRGVRFTQFYAAAPVCSPSRAGLLTGRHPVRAGMPTNASPVAGNPGMPSQEVTIAEILRPAGYATGHVGKWHLGYSTETMPLAQGFDSSFGHMGGCIDNYSHFYYWSGPNRHDLHRDGREVQAPGRFFGDLMIEEGISFLQRNKDRPFFLYFAINEPHYPYQGDPKWLEHYAGLKYPRNLYAAFLSTMDERIGRLIAELDALGLRERTIVIMQSDHGHSTEERAHYGGGSAGPYRGAKYSLFEGGIRVPAIVSWPGHLPQNEVRAQVAHGCDWLPTIAELCDVAPTKNPIDGKSLVPVIRSADAPSPHDVLHWQFESSWAVRAGDWKLLQDVLDTSRSATGERIPGPFLVNLRDDPSEKTNVAAAHPDIVARLDRLRTEWAAGLAQPTTQASPSGPPGGQANPQPRPAETNRPASSPAVASSPTMRVTRLISPDGTRLAYGQVAVGPRGEETSRIVVANADGSRHRAIDIALKEPVEVIWLGNDRIAFRPPDEPRSYQIISLEGRKLEMIQMPDECDSNYYQILSPDGRKVAFSGHLTRPAKDKRGRDRREPYDYGIFVVELGSKTLRKVFPHGVKTTPAWSPDSRYLAVGAADGYVKDYPLAIIDVQTGEVQQPACTGVGVAWSADGRRLAFTTEVIRGGSWSGGIPMDGRIGVWDLDRQRLTLVSTPGINTHDEKSGRSEFGGARSPVWSPDGRWIAYLRHHALRSSSEDAVTQEIWVVHSDGTAARRVLNHPAEVAWTHDSRTLIWQSEGRIGQIAIADEKAPPDPGPAPKPDGAFCVEGTVTDEQGRPLSGVSVKVARGWYTLRNSYPVRSDEKGHYEIHFDPGMLMFDNDVMLQCAIVHASKPGYYDRDLGRRGNLGMAYKRPPEDQLQRKSFVDIVYPGHPYRLDFVMRPAAKLRGRLVDPQGQPLAHFNIGLMGPKYPATTMLTSLETDDQGRFADESVPRKTYRFELHSRHARIPSEPLHFERAGDYDVIVTYDAIKATLNWSLVRESGAP